MDKTLPKFSIFEVIKKVVVMVPGEQSVTRDSLYFSTRELAEQYVNENLKETAEGKRTSFSIKELKVNETD